MGKPGRGIFRKRLIIACCGFVIIAVLVFFLLLNKRPGPGTRYNIVLIVSDALRHDALGCYGGETKTPNIDSLAENGVLFENAYSTAPCTLPSSVSMFTGNYSSSYTAILEKVGKNRRGVFYVNEKEKLLGEALKDKGYDLVMEIENDLASSSNNLQGFRKLRPKKKMSGKDISLTEAITGIRDIDAETTGSTSNIYNIYQRMYSLLHYLITLPEDKNFFLVKWFTDPHAPYNPPAKFKRNILVDTSSLPREESFYSQNYTISFRDIYKKGAFSADELNYLKALYKAEIESVDERVGFILKALAHRRLLKNTIIVFTSDHGEAFGEHGWFGHGQRFSECQVRVPLIFSGPGIKKGKRVRQVISHLGLMPTLKKLARAEFVDNMKGKDYQSLLNGEEQTDRKVYFDWITNYVKGHNVCDALRMNNYKLIVNRQKAKTSFKLYDLRNDPNELHDVSKANKKITRLLFKEIKKLRKENKKRLKKNLVGLEKNVNLIHRYSETLKKLKSLGYVLDK